VCINLRAWKYEKINYGSDLTAADLAQQRVWRGWVSSGGGKLTPGPYTVSTNRNGQFTVTLDLSVAGLNTSEISGFGVPVLTVRSSIAGDSILFNGAGIGFDGNGNVSTLNFRVSPDVKCTTKDGYEMCVIGEDF